MFILSKIEIFVEEKIHLIAHSQLFKELYTLDAFFFL